MRSSFVFAACLVALVTSGCGMDGAAPSVSPAAGAAPEATTVTNRIAAAVVSSGIVATNATNAATVDAETTDAFAVNGSGLRHLYVGNGGSPRVTIYAKTARGNVAPERTIEGPNTGITCVRGVAVDARGYVYVANFSDHELPYGYCNSEHGGSILVFAPGANGDVAPARTIAGRTTTIDNANAVAVAPDGSLFVASVTIAQGAASSSVLRFDPGASGDAAPSALSAQAGIVNGITLDPTLGLITSAAPDSPSFADAYVGYLQRDLSSGGPAITWDDPGQVASDPATHSFLGVGTIFGSRVDRYVDGSTGAYAPPPGGPQVTPGLVSSLDVATCPTAVGIGPMRTTFVAGTCPASIAAYAPDASGSAKPLRTIAGPATKLDAPAYVVVGV